MAIILLVLLTFLTKFNGNTDVFDYANVAKFFAGDYDAKIRSTHSYFYGFMHSPFVDLFDSFWIFKVTSLVSLLFISYSVFIISKNKKAFLLLLASPAVWYMGPWISPIQLASLLFLWSFYFVKEFRQSNNYLKLTLSGVLIGLGSTIWDPLLFFGAILLISYLYDKNLIAWFISLTAIIIGLVPRFILEYFLFGFPLYGIIRYLFGVISFSILGGFYNQGSDLSLINILIVLLFIPFTIYIIYRKENLKNNLRDVMFISLSSLFVLSNPQIRFIIVIVPIMAVLIADKLSKREFIFQIAAFIVVSLIVINPYIIQIKYGTNADEFGNLVKNFNRIEFYEYKYDIIERDLNKISRKYGAEIFVVGNRMDEYADMGFIYWGNNISEFVSIQDYNLFLENETTLQEEEFCTRSKIQNRRDYCFTVRLRKSFNDSTDYSKIKYAIAPENKIELDGFEKIEELETLRIFEKR